MKHYYALAVDLETKQDHDGLHQLADEWLNQGFKYPVYGALLRAVDAALARRRR